MIQCQLKYINAKVPIVISILFLVISSCISPFEPNIEKYEEVLVVDGGISNIPGSVYVKLSKTSVYTDRREKLLNSAKITLIDDLGNMYDLENTSVGYYTLPDSTFSGQIGRSYKIHVETIDGIICESEFEPINDPIPLDSIRYSFKSGSNDVEMGVQISVDVNNRNNANSNFYWEYNETWKYEVPYVSNLEPNSSVCYKSVKPPHFIIASTKNLSQNSFSDYPIYFINNTTNRLFIKYSVIITQHTITDRNYLYYQNLIEVNESNGSLFDKTPVTLTGNMRNLSDPEQPILGNFQVSGAVTKRIFISNNEIKDYMVVPSGFSNCSDILAGQISQAFLVDSLLKAGWIIMDADYNRTKQDTMLWMSNSRGCYDCKTAGTNIKPDFWED